MRRLLLTLIVVVALTAAGAALAANRASASYVRSIVPNVGVGGVKLGDSLPAVHRRLGGRGPQVTGVANSGDGEDWIWGVAAGSKYSIGPQDALTVEYGWVNGKPGPVSFLSTPGAWGIAGTDIVAGEHGNIAALRRFFGKRLLGPYIVGPPLGKDHSSAVYYELPGRYLGRRVHTLFNTSTYPADADEFLGVSVSFCVETALFRDANDIPCHTA
jgi:hypothetical protein